MIRVISAYSHTEIFCGTQKDISDFILAWGFRVVAGEDDWVCVA